MPDPLLDAAKNDDAAQFETLAKSAKVAPLNRVHYARQAKTPAGRDAILKGVRAAAPFHKGAVAICHDDLAALQAAHKAGVDWQASLAKSGGYPAVHLAALLGRTNALRALAELGVDLTRRASFSMQHQGTPLAFALEGGHWETAEYLLGVAGVDPNSTDVIQHLGRLTDAQLETLVSRGLRMAYVADHFGAIANSITPAGLERLLRAGLPVSEVLVASYFEARGVTQAPVEEDVALARELLKRSPPPPSGVVRNAGGTEIDLLERVVLQQRTPVLDALIESGIAPRMIPVDPYGFEAEAKRAWMKAHAPSDEFAEFVAAKDQEINVDAIAKQLSMRDSPAFGPIRLGMKRDELPKLPGASWAMGPVTAQVSSHGLVRRHSVEVFWTDDGTIVFVGYTLEEKVADGQSPTWPVEQLTSVFGTPDKRSKELVTWSKGNYRVSTCATSRRQRRGESSEFGAPLTDIVAIELIDERYKMSAPRFEKFMDL
jgi:hypothetical protein